MYSVTVQASVRDLAGNAIGSVTSSHFSSLDPSIDRIGPQVVSVCPTDDAKVVSRTLSLACNASYPGKIVIVFDEPLSADTVTTGSVHLFETVLSVRNDITLDVRLSVDGRTVLITPRFETAQGLRNNTIHLITLSPTITDAFGNALRVVDQCSIGTGEGCINFGT